MNPVLMSSAIIELQRVNPKLESLWEHAINLACQIAAHPTSEAEEDDIEVIARLLIKEAILPASLGPA